MLLQHPGTENVHNFTPVFQRMSSVAAFSALYSFQTNCISRGIAASLPTYVNHRVSGLLAAEITHRAVPAQAQQWTSLLAVLLAGNPVL